MLIVSDDQLTEDDLGRVRRSISEVQAALVALKGGTGPGPVPTTMTSPFITTVGMRETIRRQVTGR